MIATKQTQGQRAKLVRFKSHLAPIFAKAKKEDSFLNESLCYLDRMDAVINECAQNIILPVHTSKEQYTDP